MIVPIHGLKYYQFYPLMMNEPILLLREPKNYYDKNAVAAYNLLKQKFGYVSAKDSRNIHVQSLMADDRVWAKVFLIYSNQILVELPLANYTPPKNFYTDKLA